MVHQLDWRERSGRLRKLRKARGWTLRDVARVLGVTEATISRCERGLQEPSDELESAWTHLLTGKRPQGVTAATPRRRPRGLLSALAETFLADARAGMSRETTGWREPAHLGLASGESFESEPEIARDALGRIRISPDSSHPSVRQARELMDFRVTVQREVRQLDSALPGVSAQLLEVMRDADSAAAVTQAGIARMFATTARVLEVPDELLARDAALIWANPDAGAQAALRAVGIAAPDSEPSTVQRLGLSPFPRATEKAAFDETTEAASRLFIPTHAERLGKNGLTCLGAAWVFVDAVEARSKGPVSVEGERHVGDVFWDVITGSAILTRDALIEAWTNLTDGQPVSWEEELGRLLWLWPEAL